MYIVAVSFIGGGNRRKPPTCHKSLTYTLSHNVVSSTSRLIGLVLWCLTLLSTIFQLYRKTDCHDIHFVTEILLKMELSTITLTLDDILFVFTMIVMQI
jgi:hypothetical protein